MARRKDKKSPNKHFKNSPFKTLKGLAVSDSENLSSGKPAPDAALAPEAEEDDEDLFAREMQSLKVQKTSQGGRARPLPEELPVEEPAPSEKKQPASEQDLFLEALGSMDKVFRDELPSLDDSQAAPRRMRQLRLGKRVPEAELDLHGATRAQAREKVGFFLEDCVYQGFKTALIITGRGRGSEEGPVLRQDLEKYLAAGEAKAWVVEWGRAPARYGGEGALVVFLRASRRP